MKKAIVTGIILACSLIATAAQAQQWNYRTYIQGLLDSNIKIWLQDPVVIESIQAQNTKHAALQEATILSLDQQWRTERTAKDQPLITAILAKPLSTFLKKIKEQNGDLFSEIFLMDNKGLNVGQSDVTSDYWQGDEVKWQHTYLAGPEGVVIGDRELDNSSGKFLIQVSVSVVEPDTQEAIGAATIGVNLVELMRVMVASTSR